MSRFRENDEKCISKQLDDLRSYICTQLCRHFDYNDESLTEDDLDELECKYCRECPVQEKLWA